MGLLRWIAGFIIALAIAAFAIFNQTSVSVVWNPLASPISIPFYLASLALMALGFILGAFVVWANTDPLHFKQRRQRKTIKNLEKQLETLHEETTTSAPADFFPSLPAKLKRK